ncbi:unnamed protein product [Owenia fusiformis]|uniref:Ion transport domain-containing protein n=1 Tax=Owenia fusiformis TaxID=6347 RepID=A0A8J1TG76_OWEFU|nr:unnamed protein product [Owenia fusiformis]
MDIMIPTDGIQKDSDNEILTLCPPKGSGYNMDLGSSVESLKMQTAFGKTKVHPSFSDEFTEKEGEIKALHEYLSQSIATNDTGNFEKGLADIKKSIANSQLFGGLLDNRLVNVKYGGTLLQEAIFHRRSDMARQLMRLGGKELILKQIVKGAGEGGTVLHGAVVQSLRPIVKEIFTELNKDEIKQLLYSKAIGAFFKRMFKSYETPLFLALLIRDISMVKILLAAHVESLFVTDSCGQNILHILVKLCKTADSEAFTQFTFDVYNMIWEANNGEIVMQHLASMENNNGMTPMLYAISEGEFQVVHRMMQTLYRHEDITCGPSALATYDVTEIETCSEVGTKNALPGISLFALSYDCDRKRDIFYCQPWALLSKLRWRRYAPRMLVLMILQLIIMISITIIIVDKPTHNYIDEYYKNASRDNLTASFFEARGYDTHIGKLKMVLDFLIPAICFLSFVNEIMVTMGYNYRLMKKGLPFIECVKRQFSPAAGIGLYCVMQTLFGFSIFISVVLSLLSFHTADIFSAIGLICGFIYLTFYARSIEYTSLFTVSITKMLFGDISRFLAIISVYHLGFSTAFFVLFKNTVGGPPEDFETYWTSMLAVYKLMLGLSDFSTMEVEFETVLCLFYLCYTMIITVMLFNMLIGIMANTINAVAEQTMYLAQLQRLSCIVAIENRIPFENFASTAIKQGWMTVKTVIFAGKKQKRLFIQCEEEINVEPKPTAKTIKPLHITTDLFP